jgi:hypothetical protein
MTYLSLGDHDNYLKEELIEDPVAGNKFATDASLER